jgi:hypothetical protein
MVRNDWIASGLLLWVLLTTAAADAATCTGSANCRACKSCSSCKHCNSYGGTCGVCSAAARVTTPVAPVITRAPGRRSRDFDAILLCVGMAGSAAVAWILRGWVHDFRKRS